MLDVDALAARMAEIYVRQTEERKVKWGHLPPSDRSLWRLIAKTVVEEMNSGVYEKK